MRVLIAEDELQNQRLLQRILSKMEIESSIVENGGDVLKSKDEFNLLILDLSLPDMDGIDVAKSIRSGNTALSQTLPILVISGKSESLMKSYCEQFGINDFIQKPFGLDDLKSKITALMQ